MRAVDAVTLVAASEVFSGSSEDELELTNSCSAVAGEEWCSEEEAIKDAERERASSDDDLTRAPPSLGERMAARRPEGAVVETSSTEF